MFHLFVILIILLIIFVMFVPWLDNQNYHFLKVPLRLNLLLNWFMLTPEDLINHLLMMDISIFSPLLMTLADVLGLIFSVLRTMSFS